MNIPTPNSPSACALFSRMLKNKMTPEDFEFLRGVYLKLPLPVSCKRIAKQAFLAFCRFGRVLAGNKVADRFDKPAPFPSVPLAAQQPNVADYFVFSVIDWGHFQQRPQHLSRELAKNGHRVFFVSPQLKHADHKGFDIEPLDGDGGLFSIRINAYLRANIHYRTPDAATTAELLKSIGELLCWARSRERVFLVEHPAWFGVVSQLPGGAIVYDCMDYHLGFSEKEDNDLKNQEDALLAAAGLTIVTSQFLEDAVKDKTRQTAVIRNAGEYTHFSAHPEIVHADPASRKTLGYFGMIAEWFDVELVKKLAEQFPDCRIVLIGDDTVNVRTVLKKYPNVIFTGKIPYAELPSRLYGFDICLLPFKPIPLIQATNPVKVYEYLSAGKPVVSIDVPEMSQFAGLVYTAKDHDGFIAHVARLLHQEEDACLPEKRREFAQSQTWKERGRALIHSVKFLTRSPKISIIVVTYNNLHLTKTCLSSVERFTFNANHEVIVVDNASSDGTPEFLREWQAGAPGRHILLNPDNKGFAAANNQGLKMSDGDFLVLLNNDTHVTPGWDITLMHHLERNPSLGLLCPATNNIGNEAKIPLTYKNMEQMLEKACQYMSRHIGQLYPLRTTAFFCVMFPRSVFNQVGYISEEYGRGWFEDDDYCRRAEQHGYTMACAEDAFVHHELSASFNALPSPERKQLFENNKALYEKKWGPWLPHRARPQL